MLPDREPTTIAAWLTERPSIEIIARDRGGGYGVGAAKGRPEAVQVADCWHLFENASAAFLLVVKRHMREVRPALGHGPIDPATLTAAERLQHEGWKRRVEADAAVLALHAERVAIKEIVRRTGRSRKVVRDVVRGGRSEPFRPRASSLEPWLDHLNGEWNGGCHKRRRTLAPALLGRLSRRSARRHRMGDPATARRSGQCAFALPRQSHIGAVAHARQR